MDRRIVTDDDDDDIVTRASLNDDVGIDLHARFAMHKKQTGGAHEDLYVAIGVVAVIFIACVVIARRAAHAPAVKLTKRD